MASGSHIIVHRAEARGSADHGWLVSRFSFSFAEYYDPQKMGFGVLRVLNDDTIAGGAGFGLHPHENMEIITLPLAGALRHEDDLGHMSVIRRGEAQVMSAGTGVLHSEYNADAVEAAKLLQIWILPNVRDVAPRYDQAPLIVGERKNVFHTIVAPQSAGGLWIHQEAWLSLGVFERQTSVEYALKRPGNGLYLFIIAGEARVERERLGARDGCGVSGAATVVIEPSAGAEILLLDIPMR